MKLTYRCQLCGEEILTNVKLSAHIALFHRIQCKEYYDKFMIKENEGKCIQCGNPTNFVDVKVGYNKFCSAKCRSAKCWERKADVTYDMKCQICNFTITSDAPTSLAKKMYHHLKKTHQKTIKEYYDEFLKKPGEGVCKYCGKPTTFDSLFKGYSRACSGYCAAHHYRKEQSLKEKEFKKQLEETKKSKEEEYKNYIQELKDRVHEFDWEGERNTWAGGTIAKSQQDKNNLLTDNSLSYIDGQEFNSLGQTITENEEMPIDAVFWL